MSLSGVRGLRSLCGSLSLWFYFFNTAEWGYIFTFLSLSEFAITDTELKAMAALAKIGLKKIPKSG